MCRIIDYRHTVRFFPSGDFQCLIIRMTKIVHQQNSIILLVTSHTMQPLLRYLDIIEQHFHAML